MSKHKKRKLRTPPLSYLDKAIYGLTFFIFVAFYFGAIIVIKEIKYHIAMSIPSTIGYYPHATTIFMAPALYYIIISLTVFTIHKREERKPIFGNRKINYGTEPWNKDIFPFFSKEKKQYIKPSEKRFRRKLITVWCTGLVISILLFPFGLFGRTSLSANNDIAQYNIFNKIITEYTADDFDELILKTNYRSPRFGAPSWEYIIVIKTKDGNRLSFSDRDLTMDTNEEKLEKITEIKGFFSADKITITGENNLNKVVDYLQLNDTETALLYNLFSMNQ